GGVRLHVRDHGMDAPGTPQPAPVNADWVSAAIERLKMLGLLHANSPRLRLDPGFRPLAQAGSDETAIKDRLITQLLRDALLNKMRDWQYCAAELGNILGAIEWAAAQQRWNDVIALSRAIDPYITLHGLWNAWAATLDRVLQAARAINDRANEAWALHQLGTHALCIGQTQPAIDQLRQALELRRTLGDTVGMAYTQHNLDILIPPPVARSKPQSPREPAPAPKAAAAGGLGFFKSLLIVIVVLGILAGGVLFSGGFITGVPTLEACNRFVPVSPEALDMMTGKIDEAKSKRSGERFDLPFTEVELNSYVRNYTEQTQSLINGQARMLDSDVVVICGQNIQLGNLPIVARFHIMAGPDVDQPFQLDSVAVDVINQPNSTFGWVALPNALASSFTDQVKQLLGGSYWVTGVDKIDDVTWRIAIEGK
ncbi:MAG TPA: tetratricopeptide repeat protein, partial [Anaerolineae bacterium]